MSRIAAGLLMYRLRDSRLEVLLVHPGGPFWHAKDEGAWTIPKGQLDRGEALIEAAVREFREETSLVPRGPFVELAPIRQKAGKTVYAWAFEGDCDASQIVSGTFELEWPPKSRRVGTFPEVDRAEFFDLDTARRKINPAQVPLLDELEGKLKGRGF